MLLVAPRQLRELSPLRLRLLKTRKYQQAMVMTSSDSASIAATSVIISTAVEDTLDEEEGEETSN